MPSDQNQGPQPPRQQKRRAETDRPRVPVFLAGWGLQRTCQVEVWDRGSGPLMEAIAPGCKLTQVMVSPIAGPLGSPPGRTECSAGTLQSHCPPEEAKEVAEEWEGDLVGPSPLPPCPCTSCQLAQAALEFQSPQASFPAPQKGQMHAPPALPSYLLADVGLLQGRPHFAWLQQRNS